MSDFNSLTASELGHMIGQGKRIIPEIEDALNDYFPEFEVMAVEMP